MGQETLAVPEPEERTRHLAMDRQDARAAVSRVFQAIAPSELHFRSDKLPVDRPLSTPQYALRLDAAAHALY